MAPPSPVLKAPVKVTRETKQVVPEAKVNNDTEPPPLMIVSLVPRPLMVILLVMGGSEVVSRIVPGIANSIT